MESKYNQITPFEQNKNIEDKYFDSLEKFIAKNQELETIKCPFCDGSKSKETFTKAGFVYRTCDNCKSLYNSPRLNENKIYEFHDFADTDLKLFELAADQRKVRIEMLMRPRWRLIKEKLKDQGISFPVNRVMEVGPGVGYFTEVIHDDHCSKEYIEVEMDSQYVPFLQGLENVKVLNLPIEKVDHTIDGNNDLIFINSVIEHPPNLFQFFQKLAQCLKPGGIISLVDMHCDGLDHKILREETPNIHPVNILQVGSIAGIKIISERVGLEVIDVFSVGSLDTDIIRDLAQKIPENKFSGFGEVLENSGFREELQLLLQKYLLTGYNGYLIRKPF